jgi:hypothetical protein
MQLKIDKDMLIKQRFWILLGVSVLLLLVALLMLPSSVGSEVESQQKAYLGKKDSLAKISAVKNEKWVAAAKEADEYVESKKNKVWEQAWSTQTNFMTWPADLESGQHPWSKKYAYFGDPIDQNDRSDFNQKLYESQIRPVFDIVDPLMRDGSGVVQFHGGDYEAVLQLDKQWPGEVPGNTFIWLAQEDLWVKRELLRIVRAANDSVAQFKDGPAPSAQPAAPAANPQPKPAGLAATAEPAPADGNAPKPAAPSAPPTAPNPPTKPAGLGQTQDPAPADGKAAKHAAPVTKRPTSDPRHQVYHNPYWQLDLTITVNPRGERVVGGTLKNVTERRQNRYGLMFKVFLTKPAPDARPLLIAVSGLPLAAGETVKLDNFAVPKQLAGDALYGVEQVLTWRTAPVKRIDAVQLGAASSRTYGKKLVPPQFIQKEKDAAQAPSADQSGNSGNNAVGTNKFQAIGLGVGGGSRDSSAGDRYTDSNEQVRHMPVAMQVIVTEDAMADFLAAFANSTLRIQTLQYHWEHSHDHIQPQTDEESPSSKDKQPGKSTKLGPAQPGALRVRVPGGKGAGPQSGMLGGGQGEGGAGPGGGGMGQMMQQMQAGQQAQRQMGQMGVQSTMGMMQGMMGQSMGGGTGKFSGRPPVAGGLGKGGPQAGPVEEEEEQDLVTLSVYGLASLYERYPAKPAAPATTSAQ